MRDCLARNRQRQGRERIPEAGILASAQRLVRPSAEEGFDEILIVRALPELAFEVLSCEAPGCPGDVGEAAGSIDA